MLLPKVVEDIPRRTGAAMAGVWPLASGLIDVCNRGDIKQALIGFGLLDDSGRFAFNLMVSTTGRLLFFSCFMKSPDRRRNVFSDI